MTAKPRKRLFSLTCYNRSNPLTVIFWRLKSLDRHVVCDSDRHVVCDSDRHVCDSIARSGGDA
jgi:hypothetical protein